MPEAPLQLDADLLAAAEDLPLVARHLADGFMHGLHRSPYRGASQEFAAYRAYMPGDPVKLVDWKVFGRSDDLFVREFEAETNLRAYLFLDASRSMDFGAGATHKFNYARMLCAVLATMLQRQRDAPGLAIVGSLEPVTESRWIAPSTRIDHLDHLLHRLADARPDTACEGLGIVTELTELCGDRSMSIIVTDGLFPLEEGRAFLSQLRMRHHDAVFFHLVSPEEMAPDFREDELVQDSETGRRLHVDGVALRQAYAERLSAFFREIEGMCHDAEAEYMRIVTDQPLDKALRQFLELRALRWAS